MQEQVSVVRAWERKFPEHIVMVTTISAAGEPNIITLGWAMPTSGSPPMCAVSIGLSRYSHDLLEEVPEDVRNALTKDDLKSLETFREVIAQADWNENALKDAMMQMTKGEGFPVDTRRFFRNLYLAMLGKEQGPRAAPFLSVLKKDFVLQRLDDALQGQ